MSDEVGFTLQDLEDICLANLSSHDVNLIRKVILIFKMEQQDLDITAARHVYELGPDGKTTRRVKKIIECIKENKLTFTDQLEHCKSSGWSETCNGCAYGPVCWPKGPEGVEN